jgi:peptide chain release factor 1
MLEKRVADVLRRYDEILRDLADPAIINDRGRYQALAKERGRSEPLVEKAREYVGVLERIREDEEVAAGTDRDLRELALAELAELTPRRERLESEIKVLLLPKDERDEKNAVIEIRAGTGGEEAALFASDLYRMYSRYAESRGLKISIMDSSPTGTGGFKEIIFVVEGAGAYGVMKFERGVHRVQRVPETEASGRIHTSAATVAVLPEAEEFDVEIKPDDLRIDVYRSSGPGGQGVNTTDSAVRITHIPTGVVVTCQDERSQHKNKAKALRVLRSRLYEAEEEKRTKELAQTRKAMVGSGDRSEKIRTYNFPQGRVTDHRIGLTLHKLDRILDGELDEVVGALSNAEAAARLAKE